MVSSTGLLTTYSLSKCKYLSANLQINWKIPEQVSRGVGGGRDTKHIPYPDV
jgi:hypothetical protein